jgi:Helix-turn-helix
LKLLLVRGRVHVFAGEIRVSMMSLGRVTFFVRRTIEVPPMLSLPVIEEADRLLCEGKLSQQSIAERLGVSRASVNAIARGRRSLFGWTGEHRDAADHLTPLYARRSERCTRCGYAVYLPCRICQAREYNDRRRTLRITRTISRDPTASRPR